MDFCGVHQYYIPLRLSADNWDSFPFLQFLVCFSSALSFSVSHWNQISPKLKKHRKTFLLCNCKTNGNSAASSSSSLIPLIASIFCDLLTVLFFSSYSFVVRFLLGDGSVLGFCYESDLRRGFSYI